MRGENAGFHYSHFLYNCHSRKKITLILIPDGASSLVSRGLSVGCIGFEIGSLLTGCGGSVFKSVVEVDIAEDSGETAGRASAEAERKSTNFVSSECSSFCLISD